MDVFSHFAREHLPADPSEIESHLFSHFASELGGKEESISGESENDEFDIEFRDKPAKSGKRTTKKSENDIKSRARPRKAHEPKPFLSIGNIPPQKTNRLDPLRVAHDIRQPSFLSNPNVPFNTPSRMLASRNSNGFPMSAASSEWNSVIPRQHKQKQTLREVEAVFVPDNILVNAPFKHSVLKPPGKVQRPPSPGGALRGKTIMGTQMVAKVMAKQKPTMSPRSAGKLLKGKLKPMTPVVVEGPNIKRCMGIVPQQQTQSASNSRTVNRRRQIMSTMIEKNLFPTAHLRPQTVESLHQTSIASSLDENRMDEVKEETTESPNKTPAPVAPPPSAVVEETPSELAAAEVTQTSATNVMITDENKPEVDEKRSASFFVTESEEAEDGQKSEPSSFKDMESEVASRPRTAIDGQSRKVRFADTENSATQGNRRSRSAVARLHTKPSPQRSKKQKKEEQGQGDHIESAKMALLLSEEPLNRGTEAVSSQGETGAISQLALVNAVEQEEEGNTNNNGNQRQTLQVSVTDVRQGFNGVIQGEKRGAGNPVVGRPKTRLGQWGDSRKPDPHVKDLNINTCRAGIDVTASRTGGYSMKKNFRTGNTRSLSSGQTRARPESAGGPATFMRNEKIRAINTARPKSAYVYSTPGMAVESYGAQLNQRDRPNSACVTYALPKSRRGRKAYTDIDISEYDRDLDESKRERIALAHFVQNSRTHVCELCARSSFNCREFDGKMACETCRDQNKSFKPNILSNHCEFPVKKENDETDVSDELLINLEDIESSLNQVQQEIKASRSTASNTTTLSEVARLIDEVYGDAVQSEEQRPESRGSFLENMLNIDEDEHHPGNIQQTRKIINNCVEDTSMEKHGLQFLEEKSSASNMTVYQYAELEQDQDDTTQAQGVGATVKTEHGHSGGVIEGQISSYRTNLLQPYVEEVYMCDITGPRGGQGPTLPASPYPPLCFHVNARPPAGYVYYFAYGVDMNPSRFSTYVGHEITERYWGLLFGFKLTFNRKGVDQDAIGFPNIESAVNSSVEGALYLLKTEELALVDGHMGYPEYVEKVMLPVWFLNCTEPDELGVAQYCVPTVTYVARDAWTLTDMRGVSTEFAVRQCVHGADLVSPAYKEYIISQIT